MFTKTFSQISKSDVGIAGGKGASLGEMTRAKIPVPPGFVVLAPSFDDFVEATKLGDKIATVLKSVKHADTPTVDVASKKIQAMILKAAMPKDIAAEILKAFAALKAPLVAVRSSATAEDSSAASWAGELETYLNVKRADVLKYVRTCWASLFTPRAIFYRFEKGLDKTQVSVAVVVQAMIQSEVSGVAFTVHPVTKDRNQMIIEAGWGLGEAIVGGKVTPDSYIVEKTTDQIVEKNISEQTMMIVRSLSGTEEAAVPPAKVNAQKLPDTSVIRLAKICQGIESHYGKPQDIEWTFAKGKLSIVQSRPITTL